MTLRFAVPSTIALCFVAYAQPDDRSEFVTRSGSTLQLAGKPFRYSGPNIEWLGLVGYGPHDPVGPRYPTRFEIDDAFDTAKDMGAKVVRSQTMGDSVGCPQCIEPKLGEFNVDAFQSIDYAIQAARQRGIRLIVTLIGDCAACSNGGIGQYLEWTHQTDPSAFFSDPKLIAAFEKHVAAVLNHRNALTGIAYKDEPTILAWENCNMCGLFALFGPAKNVPAYFAWTDTIGAFIKSIDHRHLYLDTTGLFPFNKNALEVKTPDMITFEYYPHWQVLMPGTQKITPATFSRDAAAVTGRGKAYIVNEFGWDVTDWPTRDDLQAVLHQFETDTNISGDDYWALQAHAPGFGWQPIPADVHDSAYAHKGESGQWWALYYGGLGTMVNTGEDMRARAEQLRTHAYAMAGTSAPPPHMVPAAPAITSVVFGSLIAWRGSAGAAKYSVQRKTGAGEWVTICDRCATDADVPWPDPKPAMIGAAKYRVIAYNADGVASGPSEAK